MIWELPLGAMYKTHTLTNMKANPSRLYIVEIEYMISCELPCTDPAI